MFKFSTKCNDMIKPGGLIKNPRNPGYTQNTINSCVVKFDVNFSGTIMFNECDYMYKNVTSIINKVHNF